MSHDHVLAPVPPISAPSAEAGSSSRCQGMSRRLQGLETAREQSPEDHDDHEAGEHVFRQQGLPGKPDEVAQAVIGGHEFGRDDDDQGGAEAQPEAREDDGEGRRDDDVAEHLPVVRPVVPARLDEDGFDVPHAHRGVDQDQEERGNGDDHDLAHLADAEDQHHQGQDGDLGEDVNRRNDRVEGDPDRPVHPHDDPEDDAGNGAHKKPREDPKQAHPEVPLREHLPDARQVSRGDQAGQKPEFSQKLALDRELPEGHGHGRGRRKEASVEPLQPHRHLPEGQKGQRKADGKKTIPGAGIHTPTRSAHNCFSMVRFTSTSSSCQMA